MNTSGAAAVDGPAAELVDAMARLAPRFAPVMDVPAQAAPPWTPVVVSRRDDRLIVRCGDLVLKAHPAGTDPQQLAARLRVAARPALRKVLLAPLPLAEPPVPTGRPETFVARIGSQLVSAWPAGHGLGARDVDRAPWAPAGALLARLHRFPVGLGDLATLPAANVLRRLADRVARLRPHAGHQLAAPVLAAHDTLADPAASRPGRPTTVVHGDWHFGQLVALPDLGWRVIDVDDLGLGDPAWDLARPAAWFAAGLLTMDRWAALLDAYRAGGGPAVPADGDPWPVLDLPARALTVEYAATAVADHLGLAGADRPMADVDREFVAACARIAAAHRSAPD
ncbi:phosphotransferase family protein [Frankia sp. R82]|uniref:phosphotransferase family protein n=1 Tax=Frankia sp. R82 TaxID=2950553 RepID=UPI00204354DC|nr:aminoglycoside phosphotransferase family protein [Frankia sp. R82]MCM3882601.1 aminoglycoside phosphotransferase family protein [Frankia sp. R82]